MANIANIPSELKAVPHWISWRESDKCPLQLNGTEAASDNPATWTAFENISGKERIGIMFTPASKLVGIDLDDAVDSNGNIKPWALAVMQKVKSYTEFSPSGTGIHIYAEATVDLSAKKKKIFPIADDRDQSIEIYNSGRYFTVTGNVLSGFSQLRNAQGDIDDLVAQWNPVRPKPSATTTIEVPKGQEAEVVQKCLGALEPWRCDDYDEWLRVGMALHSVSDAPEMLKAWDAWSQRSGNYETGCCDKKWTTFNQNDGITIGTLVHAAKEDRPDLEIVDREKGFLEVRKIINAGKKEKRLDEKIKRQQASIDWVKKLMRSRPKASLPFALKPLADLLDDPEILNAQPRISSSYGNLDSALNGGFVPSGLYVLAGMTGKCKSTLIANLCRRVAQAGEKAVLFNLEDTETSLTRKLLAQSSEIPVRKLEQFQNAKDDEIERLKNAKADLRNIPLYIDSQTAQLTDIERSIRASAVKGAKLFCIDQTSWLRVANVDNDYEEASEISRRLKVLARELNVVVLVLVQVNRAGAALNSTGDRIQLFHLRSSGRLEQDSDGVLIIQAVNYDELTAKGSIELEVAKHRHGQRGTNVYFDYKARCARIDPANVANAQPAPAKKATVTDLVALIKDGETVSRGDLLDRAKDVGISEKRFNNFFPQAKLQGLIKSNGSCGYTKGTQDA